VMEPGTDPMMGSIYQYTGLGNTTIKNINMTQFYTHVQNGISTFSVFKSGDCLGDDGLTQTVNVQNINVSLSNNPFGIKKSAVMFDFSIPSTRKLILTIDNFYVEDFKYAFFPPLIVQGDFNDELYISNFKMVDYYSFILLSFWSK